MSDDEGNKKPSVPCTNENDALHTRREASNHPCVSDEHPVYALALSGGGIRSATFSLGLIRAMAKNRIFKRFDYLSTVSGGGYLGGMIGKLYNQGNDADTVEAGLRSKHSVLLWWIRNNGRYLTPAGVQDLLMALTQIIRAFFFNFLLMTWMAALVCAPALWIESADNNTYFRLFEITALFMLVWLASIYWFTGLNKTAWGSIAFILLISPFGSWFLENLKQKIFQPDVLVFMAIAAMMGLLILLHCLFADRSKRRNLLTRYLLYISLFAVAVGLLYGLGYAGNHKNDSGKAFAIAIVAISIAGKLIAVLLGKFERSNKALKKAKRNPDMLGLANLAGLVLAVLLLIAEAIGLSWLLSLVDHTRMTFGAGWLTVIVWSLVSVLSFSNTIPSLLNLSSMHNFYRARLERAWLAVGNAVRFPLNILGPYDRNLVATIEQVTDVITGDETPLKDYAPWAYGGPVHLITCCINQTIDDRTGMYNADRKGLALTLGPMGVETGTQMLSTNNLEPINDETLAQWIATSGAAVSTGLGSRTAPGVSFLCFLFGVRTGFWHSNVLPHKNYPGRLTFIGGAGYITGEMFARFPDLKSKQIYLTDGGHFENTGIYPLLKREVPLIVVADCGADPEYVFEDLENMVRKAHIDYGASVDFYHFAHREDRRQRKFTNMKIMCESNESSPYLLARITYRSGKTGTLLVVKPHNIAGMALDTLAYSQREDDFPQQTTVDQYFDEAQWEAYHQLGLQMGEHITPSLLRHLMAFTRRFEP
ncbi:patatin-like phospholipase family protein [Enterobacter pseudoroggenkampii]|uniref:patatin-like phospholipase family protein n=1 Tax=Enterobacter pseudoroggenkampii TaxID=2996112 RepID=UPI0025B0AFAA|nr:patatin-like phospholipase family protein [Enterobacter pseudoroggenkampii]WJW92956.1 patatin-like phospholipase family protein [Enterobacter pseudoroggenkampii]